MATIKNFPNNADEFIGAEYVMRWLHGRTSGVFGADGNLSVSANDNMSVSVSDGVGWLANDNADGCVFWNDTQETSGSKLQLSVGLASSSLPRIDRVVVSWATVDYSAKPTIEILQGTPASQPQPPALTNTTLKRQISLAQIRVAAAASKITASDITDERLDGSVCGIVTDSVSIDTSVMDAQFKEFIETAQDLISSLQAGTAAMLRAVYDPQNKQQDIFAYGPHLYKATFKVDKWSGYSGNYYQTVSVTAVDGGPAIAPSSHMTSGLFCDDTVQGEAQEALLEAANLVDKGTKTFGYGTITCTLTGDKPTADAEVYFNAKKGGA